MEWVLGRHPRLRPGVSCDACHLPVVQLGNCLGDQQAKSMHDIIPMDGGWTLRRTTDDQMDVERGVTEGSSGLHMKTCGDGQGF